MALAVCRLETDLLWWQDHHSLIINQILQSGNGATPNPPLAFRSVCCCWELVWHESMKAQLLYLHFLELFNSTCQTTTQPVVGNTNIKVVMLNVKAAKYVSVKVSRAPALNLQEYLRFTGSACLEFYLTYVLNKFRWCFWDGFHQVILKNKQACWAANARSHTTTLYRPFRCFFIACRLTPWIPSRDLCTFKLILLC